MRTKFLVALLLLFAPTLAVANDTILRSASNLRSGTVPNARLDSSSVTLYGPMNQGTANISVAYASMTHLSINGLPYRFPASRGGNGTVATEDGAGNITWASAGGSPQPSTSGVFVNVVITTVSDALNGVRLTADFVDVMGCWNFAPVLTATITTSGAGGLNTGSEAANADYDVRVGATNDCSSYTLFFSSANDAQVQNPTMFGSYTKWTPPLGRFRNNTSSNLFGVTAKGRKHILSTPLEVYSSGGFTSATLDLTDYLPRNVVSATFAIVYTVNGNGIVSILFEPDGSDPMNSGGIGDTTIAEDATSGNELSARIHTDFPLDNRRIYTGDQLGRISAVSIKLISWETAL